MNLRKCSCDHCGHKTFTKSQMAVHMTRHAVTPDLHTCEVCGKGFKIRSSLYTHRLYHDDPTIKCSMCEKKFYRNTELKQHIRRMHTMEKPFK
jgi:DNA-directed RNA polymerase subunit RPC12/RpoP